MRAFIDRSRGPGRMGVVIWWFEIVIKLTFQFVGLLCSCGIDEPEIQVFAAYPLFQASSDVVVRSANKMNVERTFLNSVELKYSGAFECYQLINPVGLE